MNLIKAVIFDLDNTLYAYESCHKSGLEAALGLLADKYLMSRSVLELIYDQTRKEVKEHLGEVAASHHRLLYFKKMLEKVDRSDFVFMNQLNVKYWEKYFEEMILFPAVIESFDYLVSRNIKIGILTDHLTEIQIKKIIHLHLDGYVTCLASSEEIGEEKPSARCFNYILEMLKCSSDEVLMVGDSLEKDIVGANNVGVKAIHFDYQKESFSVVLDRIKHYVS